MGFGTGSWLGFVAVAAMIAFAAAGGEIIIVPLAVVAAVAAVAWYIVFRAIGAERTRADGSAPDVRVRSAEAADREVHVNMLADGELPGGAEGGDDSPSAHRIALPSRDGTPWGDTDQHSAAARVPAGIASGR
ncbi:MAG TPA: hypothetical protein VG293_11025 [Solirubrobacteraceae bacterium]|jgi:hypothetical protein|nr:hypothetical protein [Solirubrobacteraceae bacterium]